MHGMDPHDEIAYWRERVAAVKLQRDSALSSLRSIVGVLERNAGWLPQEDQDALRVARVVLREAGR